MDLGGAPWRKKEHLGLERQAIKNTEEGRTGVRRVEGLLNAVQIAVYCGRSKQRCWAGFFKIPEEKSAKWGLLWLTFWGASIFDLEDVTGRGFLRLQQELKAVYSDLGWSGSGDRENLAFCSPLWFVPGPKRWYSSQSRRSCSPRLFGIGMTLPQRYIKNWASLWS